MGSRGSGGEKRRSGGKDDMRGGEDEREGRGRGERKRSDLFYILLIAQYILHSISYYTVYT